MALVLAQMAESFSAYTKANLMHNMALMRKGIRLMRNSSKVNGVLETKVPVTQNNPKKWPYCVISREYETETLQEEFPDCVPVDSESKIEELPAMRWASQL